MTTHTNAFLELRKGVSKDTGCRDAPASKNESFTIYSYMFLGGAGGANIGIDNPMCVQMHFWN